MKVNVKVIAKLKGKVHFYGPIIISLPLFVFFYLMVNTFNDIGHEWLGHYPMCILFGIPVDKVMLNPPKVLIGMSVYDIPLVPRIVIGISGGLMGAVFSLSIFFMLRILLRKKYILLRGYNDPSVLAFYIASLAVTAEQVIIAILEALRFSPNNDLYYLLYMNEIYQNLLILLSITLGISLFFIIRKRIDLYL